MRSQTQWGDLPINADIAYVLGGMRHTQGSTGFVEIPSEALERIKRAVGEVERLLSTTPTLPDKRIEMSLRLLKRVRDIATELQKTPPTKH